jgi:Zn-dependent protease with chaperone function
MVAQLALPPRVIAIGVFNWLIGADRFRHDRQVVPGIAPDRLIALRRDEAMDPHQTLALGAFCYLLHRLDASARGRFQALVPALELPDPAWSNIRHALDPLPLDGLDRDALVVHPPEAIVAAVRNLVTARCHDGIQTRRVLTGLSPKAVQHPTDRRWLHALQAIPGTGTAMNWILDTYMRSLELNLLGNGIQVTPRHHPWLHDIFAEVCETLGQAQLPELYIQMGEVNAFTTKSGRPMVVISSELLNLLDDEEIRFVLGHEVGHIRCGHVRCSSFASILAGLSSAIPVIGPVAVEVTIGPALRAWGRRCELSADRFGLLACQDPTAALRTFCKLAGYPLRYYEVMRVQSFIDQARHFEGTLENSTLDRLFELNQQWAATHPRLVLRAGELLEWIGEGWFRDIVDSSAAERVAMGTAVDEDPAEELLLHILARRLARWAAGRFAIAVSDAHRAIMSMVRGNPSAMKSLLKPVLRIELHVAKTSPDALSYLLVVLFREGDEVLRAELPIPHDDAWDAAPGAIRRDFIETGKGTVIRLLYQMA